MNKTSLKNYRTDASFSFFNRFMRLIWQIVCWTLFKPSPNCMHAFRAFILRLFGASLGKNCHIYPLSKIWAPWNLQCQDNVCIANHAVIYNQALVFIGSQSTISQEAYICTGTHDYTQKNFPLLTKPVYIEEHVWVGARAFILPGVTLKQGAVAGACSLISKNLEPWTVYQGNPCKAIRTYELKAL